MFVVSRGKSSHSEIDFETFISVLKTLKKQGLIQNCQFKTSLICKDQSDLLNQLKKIAMSQNGQTLLGILVTNIESLFSHLKETKSSLMGFTFKSL